MVRIEYNGGITSKPFRVVFEPKDGLRDFWNFESLEDAQEKFSELVMLAKLRELV